MPVNAITPRQGGGKLVTRCPFDVTLGNKTIRLRPGTVNSFLPTNIFDDVPIASDSTAVIKVKAKVVTDGKKVTGVTITADTANPIIQTPTPFALPSLVEILLAVVSKGKVFRIIGCNSITLVGVEQFRISKNPPAQPGELNYVPYYTWVPQP